MTPLDRQKVEERLKKVAYPGFSRSIVSFGLLKDIHVDGDSIVVELEHTIDDPGVLERLRREVSAAINELSPRAELRLSRKGGAQEAPPQPRIQGPPGIPGVRHIIAVASAKGGVGKSTVATNLALALIQLGQRVGLLDADIYGPSLPTMMAVDEQPMLTPERKIVPVEKDGLRMLSIGFLVPPDKAMIWRGPMVMGAVQQFLGDALWGELDVLVVDLPPGTGDAQLTLVQKVPLAGVVMVTTPQAVALIDVVRGIQMFQATSAPIIGVIENMSGFVCPHCHQETDIFGKDGGRRTSERYGVPFLGAVPIDPAVRESGDEGRPVVLSQPGGRPAQAFLECARQVLRFLSSQAAAPGA